MHATVRAAAAPSRARSTCADAPGVRSSPLGDDMVGKENACRDTFFMPGLLGLMPPTICVVCVRSQSVRDFVTEISQAVCHAGTPVRCKALSSELATQARPSQPHSRLMMPVHVGSRLASSGAAHPHTHPYGTDTWTLTRP